MLFFTRKRMFAALAVFLAAVVLCVLAIYSSTQSHRHTLVSYAMDTVVTQAAYGRNAEDAMSEVARALLAYERQLSLFGENSDISKINAAAGMGGADVAPETAALLRQAVGLSTASGGAFAVTIAPLTLAWGVTSDHPRVVPDDEIRALRKLVDDSKLQINGNHVTLPQAGMGIDLGGIAKGAACSLAAGVYQSHGVDAALLSIGGNVYARGTKPGGQRWSVGFRDPKGNEDAYIASFTMQDQVIAVSGGYERFFEQDGKTYIHIIDPRTGKPAQSDIASVGVIHQDGAVADFYSTTLFVQGMDGALAYMREGGIAIALDDANNLYVSAALQPDFKLLEQAAGQYTLHYVPPEAS